MNYYTVPVITYLKKLEYLKKLHIGATHQFNFSDYVPVDVVFGEMEIKL